LQKEANFNHTACASNSTFVTRHSEI